MWNPIDPNALPSARDILDASEAIFLLEEQLVDAQLALKYIRLRVAALESDLLHRRAWLSPVRKLTLDALSHIFEQCAEDDWAAPIQIGAVSRLWRGCLLSTPRAWTLPPLTRRMKRELIELYLKRSGQRLLHVGLRPEATHSSLIFMKDRIQCLSLFRLPPYLEGVVFPYVTRLCIGKDNNTIQTSSLKKAHFPVLRHLECYSRLVHDPDTLAVEVGIFGLDIAPLETLKICIIDDTAWLSVLNSCSSTLISLRVEAPWYSYWLSTARHSVELPNLRYFHIIGGLFTAYQWHFHLHTPSLECYIEDLRDSRGDQSHPVVDLFTVTHMRTMHILNAPLESCTSLRRLQLVDGVHQLYPLLARLTADSSLCPNLEAIETRIPQRYRLKEEESGERLRELHMKRGVVVQVLNEYGTILGGMKRTCAMGMSCI